MNGDQAKDQFKHYLSSTKNGETFEYVIDKKKLLNDGIANPDKFVKEQFQDMIQKNAKDIFEQNPDFFRQFKNLDGGKISDWEDLLEVSKSSKFLDNELIKTIVKVE